jgi:hypothetical protein
MIDYWDETCKKCKETNEMCICGRKVLFKEVNKTRHKWTKIVVQFKHNKHQFEHNFYDMKDAIDAFKVQKISFKTHKEAIKLLNKTPDLKGCKTLEEILKKYGYEDIKIRKVKTLSPSRRSNFL